MRVGDHGLAHEHRLLDNHGFDHPQSPVQDTLPYLHHPVRDLRVGLQDAWQHWPVGQLHAAGHH